MGRTQPGDYSIEWTPPAYTVDQQGKVVDGYRPREPNNWGRWGEQDQRGTQNLIGPEELVAAAQLVRTGKVFCLALPLQAMGRQRHRGRRMRKAGHRAAARVLRRPRCPGRRGTASGRRGVSGPQRDHAGDA
jgi:hypothetical protein